MAWTGRYSMRSAIPATLLFVLVLAGFVGAAVHFKSARMWLVYAGLAASVPWIVIAWTHTVLTHSATLYEIDGKIVTQRAGILSRKTAQVNVQDIRSIDVQQGLWQRLLGIGDVSLGTEGRFGKEIYFRNVENPDALVKDLQRLRNP